MTPSFASYTGQLTCARRIAVTKATYDPVADYDSWNRLDLEIVELTGLDIDDVARITASARAMHSPDSPPVLPPFSGGFHGESQEYFV